MLYELKYTDNKYSQKIETNNMNFNINKIILNTEEIDFTNHFIKLVNKLDENLINISLNFLMKLYGYVKDNNEITINIKTEEFYNISMLEDLNIVIHGKYIGDIKIMTSISDSEYKDKNFIQCIETHYEKLSQSEYNINFKFNLVSKGYFIDAHIEELEYIQLNLNGHSRYIYDKPMIDLFCKRINNLLYIPFNYKIPYNRLNINDYKGSLNQYRINDLTLILKFKNKQNYIGLYSIGYNVYNYNNTSRMKLFD
jgi:hypothetical protein